MMRKRLHLRWLLFALLLLCVEIAIARFVHDRVLRPYGGDVLAAMLVYAFVRGLRMPRRPAAVASFLFCCLIELLQYINLAGRLHIGGWMRVLLGSTFEWSDIACYACGISILLLAERLFRR